ncbi:diaminobutyrate--2-oxoglutarate transaminase [Leisingera daeponensis]|uniref:diaminobutyrate--2-oxoglutarate transaminase n=1 Tax=Leisingera daeponensis TaxID=405746 RepID=UPI001C97784D|nr:diaminobutyrate--2-oxoglutarate transaminase [Leisingera daeponensis]MBY6059664.1 diaminobutyrate--2-oxoglutarate transaminase [Leisingera daeponensis]
MEHVQQFGSENAEFSEAGVFARYESNVQSYARSTPAVFAKAVGCEIWDEGGGRYLDFLSGAGSLNYGHNNPVLKNALIEYVNLDGITHSLDLHTEAKAQFLTELADTILLPRGLDYVAQFTGPTGTNAVEAALKLARKVTGRTNVVHFTNSFHGVSLGSLSMTGNQVLRKAAGVPLQGAVCMPFDGYYGAGVDTVAILEQMLSDKSSGIDLPAAVIVETVQGEGGLNPAGWEWLSDLEALCKRQDILLIIDDIQAGCGRTGTFFSFEPAGIVPDIVTLSKSLSGYGLPLALVLMKRELDHWEPGEHNGTFRGNNHAFVTAAATLRHYWRSNEFSREVMEKADYLEGRLRGIVARFPKHLERVKGRGFMRGISFADASHAAAVRDRCYALGLICERCGADDEVVKCMAPLTVTPEELAEGLDILERATGDVLSARGSSGPKIRIAAS